MQPAAVSSFARRIAAPRWWFLAICFSALVVSLGAPLIGAKPSALPARHFVLHAGHAHARVPAFLAPRLLASGPPGSTQPVPIPGGLVLPPLIHVFAPGPQAFGSQGTDVEPTVITNYRGFTAMGYPTGSATDTDGNSYDMSNDMRVFQGEYISTDGTHHTGTFVFI